MRHFTESCLLMRLSVKIWALFSSQVLSGGRILSLSSAQVSDTGRYTCVAVNAGGEQHREYDLKVYGEKVIYQLLYIFK